jgi:multiple sugar transport system permease protein
VGALRLKDALTAQTTIRSADRRLSILRPATIRRIFAHTVLVAGALTMIAPFLWMISTALKGDNAVLVFPPIFIPRPIAWQNFEQLFQREPFALYLSNSFWYASLSTVGQLLTCSMAAYVFARLRFPGRDLIFLCVVASIMIPYQVTMIPVFILVKYLGWINSFKPLIVPNWLAGAFGTFMLRQFFLTIPGELMDAAKIDGSNFYGIYYRIFLPLAGPALATLGVFTFMWSWNDLLGPLIYLNRPSTYTASIGLALFQAKGYVIWNEMMAGALVSLVPIILIFLLAQKYFVQGIATTGLKR